MTMHIIEKATYPPGYCAISTSPDGPFFDTGTNLPGLNPRVYLAVSAVEQLARERLGMVSKEHVAVLAAEVAALHSSSEALLERIAEAERFEEAARYTLEKFGQEVRHKPGRRKPSVKATR